METAAAPVGEALRDRRRRETTLEICEAALDLFEEKGVARTTVDEIAARAGVSARTFFRLSGTKEDAVFIDDGRFAAAFAEIGTDGDDIATLTQALREVFARELDRLHADAHARTRFLRVRRLIGHEPTLLGAAIRRETTSSDLLFNEIAARIVVSERDERAAIGLAALEMRTALDEWARRADRGEEANLPALHREIQTLLGAAAAD